MKNKVITILLFFIAINVFSVLIYIFADDLKVEVKLIFVIFAFFVSTLPGAYQYCIDYEKEEYENVHNKFPGISGMTIILLLSPLLFCKYIYNTLKRKQ